MATSNYGPRGYSANLAISAFRGVVLSNNGGVTYSTTTGVPDGFAQIDTASGDLCPVRHFFTDGTQLGVITVACTVGDALYAGSVGYLAVAGTVTVGKSLTTASASTTGNIVEFIPRTTLVS